MPVQLLRSYVEVLSRAGNLFAKPYAQTMVPQLKEGIFDTVLALSDIELRDLSKEVLEEIVKVVSSLLRRVEPTETTRATVEFFNLAAAYRRFQSSVVERRINGLTALAEIVARVRYHTHYRTAITPPQMLVYLAENKVLETCFGKGSHPELMKRSLDIFRFIAQEQKLEKRHLDLIWDAIRNAMRRQEDATLAILFKLLDDIAYQFDLDHLLYLFDRMAEIPCEEYVSPTLDLIKELGRMSYKAGSGPNSGIIAERSLELLWRCVLDESKTPPDVQTNARIKLEEMVADYQHRSQREPYLHKCIANLQNHSSVPQSLDIMRKILESYQVQTHQIDEHSRAAVIEVRCIFLSLIVFLWFILTRVLWL